MAVVYRMQVGLTGWNGGPGVNTWHFMGTALGPGGIEAFAQDMYTAYDAMKSLVHSNASFDGTIESYEASNGQILGIHSAAPWNVTATAGSTLGNLSRATQAKMQLNTGTIRGRKFLRGGCYIGPIAESVIDSEGAITPAAITTLTNAFNGMISGTGAGLAVWGRPRSVAAADGVAAYVETIGVMKLPAVLRRRRS